MKKYIFSILLILTGMNILHAQIKSGQKLIGGTIEFSFSKGKVQVNDYPGTNTSFMILPQFGWGLKKNWIVGGGIGYSFSKEKTERPGLPTTTIKSLPTAGVFVRKFHPFTEKLGIFGQFNGLYGRGIYHYIVGSGIPEFDEVQLYISEYSATVSPGFYFKPANNIVIEAVFGKLGYTGTKNENLNGGPTIRTTDVGFSFTNSFSLSFQVIL